MNPTEENTTMNPADQHADELAYLRERDAMAWRGHLLDLLATLDDQKLEELARHAGVLVGTVSESMAKPVPGAI